MPDALETGCSKCTEKQRVGSNKVIDFIYTNRPNDWVKMEKLYDPTGIFRKNFNFDEKMKATTEAEPQETTKNPNEE